MADERSPVRREPPAGAGDAATDARSMAFTEGARFGELLARQSALERAFGEHMAAVKGEIDSMSAQWNGQFRALTQTMDERHAQQSAQLGRVVAFLDTQEKAEAQKRTQAEERDRRTGQVLSYVIGVLLLVLTNTLRNVLEATTQGLPAAVATYLQAGVSALIVLAVIYLAARGRGAPPAASGGGGH